MNKYFLLVLLLTLTTSLFAKENKYYIHGIVKNKNNWSVEYANIGIFKEDKSIAGCSSNTDEKFEINVDVAGTYF